MLMMLYQSGVVICLQNASAVEIPIITFPSSWIDFINSYNQNQDNDAEETSLIEVVECLILFEEFINKRNMSVTSHSIPTCATDPSSGGGLKAQSCRQNPEKRAPNAPG
jgi:hypothetical protein